MQEQAITDDEISLLDIYDFLVEGWKTILAIALIGTSIGTVTSLVLPEQFEAKALIEGARLTSSYVEANAVVAEKMRSPTYYDSETLAVCMGEGKDKNLELLAKALNANVARNSNYVAVSYRADSTEDAVRCLKQVLQIVIENQQQLVSAGLTSVVSNLENLKKKADELRKTIKQLESDRGAQFEFKNIEYSAAALITVTLQSKVQELLATENQISAAESMLKPPNTQDAKFATPIFASEQRVSPRRSLIVMISAIGSLFLGVLILMLRKFVASIKKQREERQNAAEINV
ncbi:Wzz/FepE/Etk N-terminal domain-containing protein [Rheinheimera sp.]|uniref:Wzz/FepE/Etk N-terminal domain-containing protein n=1 Tax=Rheinheimera sp. TaxID=1869214 RepID=UPI0040471213